MLHRAIRGGVLLVAALAWGSPPAEDAQEADLILRNAVVHTGADARGRALAIRGERVAAVGDEAGVLRLRGPRTRVIDAGARLVVPGINDAHVHWAPQPEATDLGLASMEPAWDEVVAELTRATARAPRGGLIFGSVGARVIEDPRATLLSLDAVAPEHAVLLDAWTGHGMLLNSAALRALGLSEAPARVAGGRVGRDASGRFDGWLFEYAEWPVEARLQRRVSREQSLAQLRAWAAEAAGFGITSLQVMPGVPTDEFVELLREAGVALRVRVIWFPTSTAEEPRRASAGARLRLDGVKWVLDGTPVERGAATRAAYADQAAARGELNLPQSFVRESLRATAARGEQSLFHCAGDRCAGTVLDAMDDVPGVDWPARRVRLEHGDGLLEDLARRAARMGVVVVQNPTHFTIGELLAQRFGPRHRFMPLKSLLEAGVALALGSDGPMNPFLNITLASTHPARPEEALTREQALAAYTRGSAYAEHAERDKGTLAPGMLADLAVLSQDIFAVPAEELPATTSVLTLVGGQVVHDAGVLERRP